MTIEYPTKFKSKSNFKKVSSTASIRGLIRISEEQWFMKGFAKAGQTAQARFFDVANRWIAERPFVIQMMTEASTSQRADIHYVLAASFWGTEQREGQEQHRIENLIECWKDVPYEFGGFPHGTF